MSATESPAELLDRLAREREETKHQGADDCPICITGSRHREPPEEEMQAFWRIFVRLGGTSLHDGDCRGTDRKVRAWMKKHHPEIPCHAWPVRPEIDGDWPAAGPRRNKRMLVQSSAKYLIPFPGGTGTASCTRIARELGRAIHSVADELRGPALF